MSFGTIFFIVVTVIILFQLRSVLGRRTGNERPPFDPYSRPETGNRPAAPGNVITLPSRPAPLESEVTAQLSYDVINKLAEPGTQLNDALRRIKDADPAFDPKDFIDGAKMAYEMIVTAFAEGDRKMLKPLLSNEVYKGFDQAISERERRGEKMQFSFVGFDDAKLIAAELKDKEASITLRLISQIISAVVKPNGETVEGDPEAVVEVRDIWTFSRDTRSRDPNWKLTETRSEE